MFVELFQEVGLGIRRTSGLVGLFLGLIFCAPVIAQVEDFQGFGGIDGGFQFGDPIGGGQEEVTYTASFEVQKGTNRGQIHITAILADGWHTYPTIQPEGAIEEPTLFSVSKLQDDSGKELAPNFKLLSDFQPDRLPEQKTYAWSDTPSHVFYYEVTWTAEIELLEKKEDYSHTTLVVDYTSQVCDEGTCLPREGTITAEFEGTYEGERELEMQAPAGAGFFTLSFLILLLSAFGGGFLLNFMPCVLPVIGLKVMAFVEQAKDDRRQVFLLNGSYVAGLMTVFMLIAVAIISFGQAWGAQFSNPIFVVSLTALLFAMALSFFGIWEIPIPGFAMSSSLNASAQKEGLVGAYLKGVLTTVLATPCSGPLVGTVIGVVIALNPLQGFLIFFMLGLGMGIPYILIGIWPKLLAFLPKPGAWMETFKQFMGFILLGTIAFFFTMLSVAYYVPLLVFLFSLWGALWWIGKTPFTAERSKQLQAWGIGTLFAVGMGLFSFSYLLPRAVANDKEVHSHSKIEIFDNLLEEGTISDEDYDRYVDPILAELEGLPWMPYSESRLERSIAKGETIMVDFTADWCGNCHALEAFVLETKTIRDIVKKNGVRCIKVDFTEQPQDIKDYLNELESGAVPTLAIYPAGKPEDVLVFKDGYLISTIKDALNKAGPSKGFQGDKVEGQDD
ncbi:MAG: thioredoxin family protein [Pirellulaceae bacterium]|nr:thioredoxin family protein [Pirellulaceae bacterium]